MEHRILKFSVVCSVLTRHDAISEVALAMALDMVAALERAGVSTHVRFYAMSSNMSDTRINIVTDTQSLLLDNYFFSSDIVICHYGVHAPIFDAMLLLPSTTRRIGVYHGITPPYALSKGDDEISRRSFHQLPFLAAFDKILTTTRHLRDELERFGFTRGKLFDIGLPLRFPLPVSLRPLRFPQEVVQLLYVGRIVAAKGVLDLAAALAELPSGIRDRVHVIFAGSSTYSDPDVTRRLGESLVAAGLGGRVDFAHDVSDVELRRLYDVATLFVLPSHHEGFGMPVMEALARGTPVLASDAGALPEVAGGFALHHRAGAVHDLREKLEAAIAYLDEGMVACTGPAQPYLEWAARVSNYLERYDPDAVAGRAISAIGIEALVLRSSVERQAMSMQLRVLSDLVTWERKEPRSPAIEDILQVTLSDVVSRLVASVSLPIAEFVAEGYRAVLKREPDQDGLHNYVEALRNGLARVDFVRTLFVSPEATAIGANLKYFDRFKELADLESSTEGAIGSGDATRQLLRGYLMSGAYSRLHFVSVAIEAIQRRPVADSEVAKILSTLPEFDGSNPDPVLDAIYLSCKR